MLIPENYVNISETAKSHGKILNDWANRSVGQKVINEFTRLNPSIENPLITKRGRGGGTYAHPELAAKFRQWCNPDHVVNLHVDNQNQTTFINIQKHVIEKKNVIIEKQAEVIKFQRNQIQAMLPFVPDSIIQKQIEAGDTNRAVNILTGSDDNGSVELILKWVERNKANPDTEATARRIINSVGNIKPGKQYKDHRSPEYARAFKRWDDFENLLGRIWDKPETSPDRVNEWLDRIDNYVV